jgi:hypothetical protein
VSLFLRFSPSEEIENGQCEVRTSMRGLTIFAHRTQRETRPILCSFLGEPTRFLRLHPNIFTRTRYFWKKALTNFWSDGKGMTSFERI